MVERATCYCPASSYILLIAQRERIYILTDARCVSLGFMWLEVKVDEEKKNKQTNKQSFSHNVFFWERNLKQCWGVFIFCFISLLFFYQKFNGSRGSAFCRSRLLVTPKIYLMNLYLSEKTEFSLLNKVSFGYSVVPSVVRNKNKTKQKQTITQY